MNNWTIETLSRAIQQGETSILEVAQSYVQDILDFDPSGPNAVITLNPFWKEQAIELQHSLTKTSSPLHGIPILIKDNIDTLDMGNSAGSIALKDIPVESDAAVVSQLKKAGVLILGKTNLSEWANFRSTASISGWSSLGGQTRNAVSSEHSPSGSSSGSAAALMVNYAVACIGTETDGSIVSPAAHNNIVGLKPTVGRVSRTGIIPIAWSQDTAGPMTKTVLDAAIMLDNICTPDTTDAITQTQRPVTDSFTTNCTATYIHGKRIGYFPVDESFPAGVKENLENTVTQLIQAGAECIALTPVPSMVTLRDHEITQMTCEFPEAIAHYLKTRRPSSPLKTLADLAHFNEQHADTVMKHFKQEWFDKCLVSPPTNSNLYKQAQIAIDIYRSELKAQWFTQHTLDAVICATNGPAWKIDPAPGNHYTGGNSHIAAVTGWPSITVPSGKLDDLPLGTLFIALPWQEKELLGIAYGYEQFIKQSSES